MQLNRDELTQAFRAHVAASANPSRDDCPSVEWTGGMFTAGGEETERLAFVDHLSTCAPCAREFTALRLLRAGHERLAPMIPDRLDAADFHGVEQAPTRGFLARLLEPLLRPAFAFSAAATLAVAFVVGAVVSVQIHRGTELAAIRPGGRITSAALTLEWSRVEGAVAYDVRMSWEAGKVFYQSDRSAVPSCDVPQDAVSKMTRGQTCYWTVRAYDSVGDVLQERTFSFVVDFDPTPA